MSINGHTLIEMGYEPGPYFKEAIVVANAVFAETGKMSAVRNVVDKLIPKKISVPLDDPSKKPLFVNLYAETEEEKLNKEAVLRHMKKLMETPTIVSAAVMPDACPAGSEGTIPVGGVVACENAIHPGFHSADVCCSVMATFFRNASPLDILNTAEKVTHFGPGGRPEPPQKRFFCKDFDVYQNPFLRSTGVLHSSTPLERFLGTQGDGNHFLFVGTLKSDPTITAIVTHHGSRKPGATLYKYAMKIAQQFRKNLCPEVLKQNAWIPADSPEGQQYWEALQFIREWTKQNHLFIHDRIKELLNLSVSDRFWNEHNFVFKRGDLFYHAKGATPAWSTFSDDTNGLTLIPLNMAEPILVVEGNDSPHGLGFSPHGAGRNISRSQHFRNISGEDPTERFEKETKGLDIRFWSGTPDLSELPSAYKNAQSVKEQIERFGLATVVEEIIPYGSIMAGKSTFGL